MFYKSRPVRLGTIVVKNVDIPELTDLIGKNMLKEHGKIKKIEHIKILKQMPIKTIFVTYKTINDKEIAKHYLDGIRIGNRLLNVINYKTSREAATTNRIERFTPTPHETASTLVFSKFSLPNNKPFPRIEFSNAIASKICRQRIDPKLIVQLINKGADTIANHRSYTAFVVYHNPTIRNTVLNALRARNMLFPFKDLELEVSAYARVPQKRLDEIEELVATLERPVCVTHICDDDKAHLYIRANDEQYNLLEGEIDLQEKLLYSE